MASLLFLILSLVFAAESPTPSATPELVLQVAISDVGPYGYKENDKIKGINYDLLSQIEKETGLKFNYTLYPHARLNTSLDSVNPDLIIFFSVSCEKFANYEIQNKLYTSKPTLFLKTGVDLKKKDLQIGLIRGTCRDIVQHYLKPEMITDISNMEQALDMLKAGRLDGVCGLESVMEFAMQRNKDFKTKLKIYSTDSQVLEAVLCRKKNLPEDIKKKLEKAVKKLKLAI